MCQHLHPGRSSRCIASCKSCGDECEEHGPHMAHCRLCAESCRRCEQACRDLLAVIA